MRKNHDCKNDSELVGELERLLGQIETARWRAIFMMADAQHDHPNRDCRCPLSLSERMVGVLAGDVAEKLAEVSIAIARFLGNEKGGTDA